MGFLSDLLPDSGVASHFAAWAHRSFPRFFSRDDGRPTPHDMEFWAPAPSYMPKPVTDARDAPRSEHRFLSDLPDIASGVLRPHAVSSDSHPSGVACEIDVRVGHAPSPRAVVSTIHHEMVHCGLRDLLGPGGRDNFLAHIAEHVPLPDLVGTWYASIHDRAAPGSLGADGASPGLAIAGSPTDAVTRA